MVRHIVKRVLVAMVKVGVCIVLLSNFSSPALNLESADVDKTEKKVIGLGQKETEKVESTCERWNAIIGVIYNRVKQIFFSVRWNFFFKALWR